MASNAADKQQQHRDVDNLISCVICYDHFVDPRILPCSHTFCLKCIRQIASSNDGRFKCPMRDGTTIENDQLDSLPINRAVRDMVDVLSRDMDTDDQKTQKTRLSASHCCECLSAIADFWCTDCADCYCTACCTHIHKGRALAQHRRVTMAEKPVELKRCDKHRDQQLRYWCNCETLTCMDCQLSKQHKDHSPVPISEIVSEITDKIRTDFEQAQRSLGEAITQGTVLREQHENTNVEKITQIFDDLYKVIDSFKNVTIDKVQTIEQKNKTSTDNYLEQLISKQATLSDHSTQFDNILSTNDPVQLLEARKTFLNYLEELMKELTELEPFVQIQYRIEGIDQLQTSIENILSEARVVEVTSESQQFATPGTRPQLECAGRPCFVCGECRDWYYTSDSAGWNWIRDWRKWTDADLRLWHHDRVDERFERREGATCGYDTIDTHHHTFHFGHHFHHQHHACVCTNNTSTSMTDRDKSK